MCRQLSIIYKWKVIENVQVLQHNFYELHMKLDSDVVDHINNIELMANRLYDLGDPIFEQAIITKVISILPPNYKHLLFTSDNFQIHQQTVES